MPSVEQSIRIKLMNEWLALGSENHKPITENGFCSGDSALQAILKHTNRSHQYKTITEYISKLKPGDIRLLELEHHDYVKKVIQPRGLQYNIPIDDLTESEKALRESHDRYLDILFYFENILAAQLLDKVFENRINQFDWAIGFNIMTGRAKLGDEVKSTESNEKKMIPLIDEGELFVNQFSTTMLYRKPKDIADVLKFMDDLSEHNKIIRVSIGYHAVSLNIEKIANGQSRFTYFDSNDNQGAIESLTAEQTAEKLYAMDKDMAEGYKRGSGILSFRMIDYKKNTINPVNKSKLNTLIYKGHTFKTFNDLTRYYALVLSHSDDSEVSDLSQMWSKSKEIWDELQKPTNQSLSKFIDEKLKKGASPNITEFYEILLKRKDYASVEWLVKNASSIFDFEFSGINMKILNVVFGGRNIQPETISDDELERAISIAIEANDFSNIKKYLPYEKLSTMQLTSLMKNSDEIFEEIFSQLDKEKAGNLLLGCLENGEKEVARKLVNKGVKVDTEAKIYGFVPLVTLLSVQLLRNNQIDELKLLIQTDPSLANQLITQDESILMRAARIDDADLFMFLVEHGADVKFTGIDGKTVLDYTDNNDIKKIILKNSDLNEYLKLCLDTKDFDAIREVMENSTETLEFNHNGITPQILNLVFGKQMPKGYIGAREQSFAMNIAVESGFFRNAEYFLPPLRIVPQTSERLIQIIKSNEENQNTILKALFNRDELDFLLKYCLENSELSIAKKLVEKGAKVDSSKSAVDNIPMILEFMLQEQDLALYNAIKIDPSILNKIIYKDKSLLMMAAELNDREMFWSLVDWGADVNLQNSQGLTAGNYTNNPIILQIIQERQQPEISLDDLHDISDFDFGHSTFSVVTPQSELNDTHTLADESFGEFDTFIQYDLELDTFDMANKKSDVLETTNANLSSHTQDSWDFLIPDEFYNDSSPMVISIERENMFKELTVAPSGNVSKENSESLKSKSLPVAPVTRNDLDNKENKNATGNRQQRQSEPKRETRATLTAELQQASQARQTQTFSQSKISPSSGKTNPEAQRHSERKTDGVAKQATSAERKQDAAPKRVIPERSQGFKSLFSLFESRTKEQEHSDRPKQEERSDASAKKKGRRM